MRPRTFVRILFFSIAALCSAQQYDAPAELPGAVSQTPRAYLNYSSPLLFEANRGQSDAQVKFLARGKGYKAFLTSGAMVLSLRSSQAQKAQTPAATTDRQPSANTTLQFKLLGASKNPAIVGEDLLPGKVNYFIGRDPAKWHTGVPTYSRIRYKNVYPGIDLVYYGSHQQLEYDFAISPGANPNQIQFELIGAAQTTVDAEGNLVLQTGSGEVHLQSPVIYQESDGVRVRVSGTYVMNGSSHIAFHVSQYDPSKPMVIDPVLIYSTYLGGSGDDQPSGIAVDAAGSVYVAGYTDSSDFPLATPGSIAAGNTHVFVAKLDSTGSNLVYADYIGGDNQDYGYALVLDTANEVYVTGSTASSDFPVVNPYRATYPGSFNGFSDQDFCRRFFPVVLNLFWGKRFRLAGEHRNRQRGKCPGCRQYIVHKLSGSQRLSGHRAAEPGRTLWQLRISYQIQPRWILPGLLHVFCRQYKSALQLWRNSLLDFAF